jgi:hypothetical protein
LPFYFFTSLLFTIFAAMKMGLLLFMLLPLAALVYVLWHVYQLLPLPTWGKWVVVVLMTMAFGMLFVGVSRRLDEMPMTLATIVYEIGTSSLIILLYLFMLFLVLDLGRLCHLVPGTLMKNSLWGSLLVFGIILVTFIYGGLHYHHKEREEIELTKDEIRNTGQPTKKILIPWERKKEASASPKQN